MKRESGDEKRSALLGPKMLEKRPLFLKKVLIPKDFLYLKASLLRHLGGYVLLLEGKKVACSDVVCIIMALYRLPRLVK
jgi:hypothetical protein